jgi:hypothetical protein
MKCLDIKTGSILIYKKYGLLKCWWNKLMRKELPFNKYTLYFGNSSMFVETTNIKVKEKDRYIILEPIKPYSKKEEKALVVLFFILSGFFILSFWFDFE